MNQKGKETDTGRYTGCVGAWSLPQEWELSEEQEGASGLTATCLLSCDSAPL